MLSIFHVNSFLLRIAIESFQKFFFNDNLIASHSEFFLAFIETKKNFEIFWQELKKMDGCRFALLNFWERNPAFERGPWRRMMAF